MDSSRAAEPISTATVHGTWLATAARRDVVQRSLRVALTVGTLLILINYGDRLLAGDLRRLDWIKMALTYLVPYGVSTYASVAALRSRANLVLEPGSERRGEDEPREPAGGIPE